MYQRKWIATEEADKRSDIPWVLPYPAQAGHIDEHTLERLSEKYLPIQLDEMDAAALLNRSDIKFVLSLEQLCRALEYLLPCYRILTIADQRLNDYRTLYFDTPDFALYSLHINERADRFKVRSREYVNTRDSFLEVKHKTPRGRTLKTRVQTEAPLYRLDQAAEEWLARVYPYNSQALEPKLWNSFTRITLVGHTLRERVTLDFNLRFSGNGKSTALDGIAVAESKHDQTLCRSPFLEFMRAQKNHPQGFSKYCIGTALLYAQVKKNPLKPKLLRLEKISNGAMYE